MTHTGTTIENVSSAVDRAEENSLNRRAIDRAFAEAGEDFLKVPINQLIARAEAIKEELRNPKVKLVKLVCNECGRKRLVAPEGQYNDRCPKCGGVDWDVVEAEELRRWQR